MSVYVIGHQNPDTDAICSAIGYADFLKRTTKPNAVPACCGSIPARTAYVLEQAGVPKPRLITTVRPTAGQVCNRKIVSARADESFHQVYQRMYAAGHRAIPIVDGGNTLVGLVSIIQLLELLMPSNDDGNGDNSRTVYGSLEQVRSALGGAFLHSSEEGKVQKLSMMVGPSPQIRLLHIDGHVHALRGEDVRF